MISVIIPTLNAEACLPATLAALVPAAVDGFVREVVVSDGGSRDATEGVADAAGADFISGPAGRGRQLKAGARRARFPWLLFLHADTILVDGWMREAGNFIDAVDQGRHDPAAAAFRFKLDDKGLKPRTLEGLVAMRCALFRLPYGDQGLLIPRSLYDAIGGFKEMPIMEDVDIVRRLTRKHLVMLDTPAITSAERFRKNGYVARALRNQCCLWLFTLGIPAERIARLYGSAKAVP